MNNELKKKMEQFKYQNNRWLSIKLLTDNTIINSIKEYLNYDISNDEILLKIIKDEQSKYEDINKLIIKRTILESERIYIKSVTLNRSNDKPSKLDKLLTSKITALLSAT